MINIVFSAGASLYHSTQQYRSVRLSEFSRGLVVPQDCFSNCQASCDLGCQDLVGAAKGQCLHECVADCHEACPPVHTPVCGPCKGKRQCCLGASCHSEACSC